MKEGIARIADPLQSPWLTALFLLMVVVLAWCNVRSPQRVRAILGATLLLRPPRQLFRDDIDMRDRLIVILAALSLISISAFIYQSAVVQGYLSPERSVFLTIMAVVLGAFLFGMILIRFTAWVYSADEGLMLYLNHTVLQLILLGVVLVPLSVFVNFSTLPRSLLLQAGVILFFITLLVRWVRGFSLGLNAGIPLLYIVLYLCAAEILPALIGLRLMGLSPWA